MLTKIELTQSHAEALARLEQSTGENQSSLLRHALDQYIAQKEYNNWLSGKVQRGLDDIEAGRSMDHDKAMASIRSFLREKVGEE